MGFYLAFCWARVLLIYMQTKELGTVITRVDERFRDKEGYLIFERTFIGNDCVNIEIITELGSQPRFIGPSRVQFIKINVKNLKLFPIWEQLFTSRSLLLLIFLNVFIS